MRFRCPICLRRFCTHRRCRRELSNLVGQAFDAVEQRQDAGSEKWTILIDAIKRSWLVQRRGLSFQDILSRVYDRILLRWYVQANTHDFVFYRQYLDQFAYRAKIERSTGLEHDQYRRLYLLSWLREAGSGSIPSLFLVDSEQSCRQFKPVVVTTRTVLQAVLRECSFQRLTAASLAFWALLSRLTAIPVPELMEKLNPEGSLWRSSMILFIVFTLFFIHVYRSAVVLDAEGLCSGPWIWKRHIQWEDVHRVKTLWGGRIIRLRLDAEWMWFRVDKQDRCWLEQIMQQFVRRAQTESGV